MTQTIAATRRIRSREVQADHARAMGGGRRSVGSLGAAAGALAGTGDRSHAGHGRRRAGRTGPRRGGRRGRADARGGAPGRRGRLRARDRHLARDPALCARRGAPGRLGQCRNARARRRAARHVARSVLRRGDLARRPDLLSRPAARARRHPPRAQARRALCRGGVFDAREESVLFPPGGHHPPARAAAAAAAGTAGAVLARRRGRPGQGAASRPDSATSKCARSTRRSGCRRPRSACASSASPSARCTR